jgi:hypothetical protein
MRSTCVALIASSMLIAPAVLAQEVVIDPGVGPVFDTYYKATKFGLMRATSPWGPTFRQIMSLHKCRT